MIGKLGAESKTRYWKIFQLWNQLPADALATLSPVNQVILGKG
jgi:hypothetical protein